MKKTLKILTLTLITSMSLTLLGCTNGDTKEESDLTGLKNKGSFTIGLDDTFVPMGFKDTTGELTGFDVELAKEVSKKMGLDVKFQPIDWSMKETELNSRNIDVIWNGYSITEKRKEQVSFTDPYLQNKQIIVTLKDSPINSKNDLKDKKLGLQDQSSAVDAVNKDTDLVSNLKNGELLLFETNNDALMDLEAGRIDAVVADEILIRYYTDKRGSEKYKILEDNFGEEEYGIGVRKEDKEFLAELNKALEDLKKDGTAAKISEKWFGENIIY